MSSKKAKGGLPLFPGEKQAMESTAKRKGVEIVIDANMVSIPVSRYEDLLRAEAERDIAVGVVLETPSYGLQKALRPVFGLRECDFPHD